MNAKLITAVKFTLTFLKIKTVMVSDDKKQIRVRKSIHKRQKERAKERESKREDKEK